MFQKIFSKLKKNKKFTICIEGNIGSGKTTFLEYLTNYKNITTIPEPLELWTNLNGNNLLELLYTNPYKYGFLFQSYALLTMINSHENIIQNKYKIMERSMHSTMCFAENLYKNNIISPIELSVLRKWYKWYINKNPNNIDLIVYLQTSPDVAYERIKNRNRNEEQQLSYEYILQIHHQHELWFVNNTSINIPIIIINANQNLTEMEKEAEILKTHIRKLYKNIN